VVVFFSISIVSPGR